MTTVQAVKEIKSRLKWYMIFKDDDPDRLQKECWLRVTAIRILKETARPVNKKKFLAHFGYEYEHHLHERVVKLDKP